VIASNRTKALREIGVGPDFEITGAVNRISVRWISSIARLAMTSSISSATRPGAASTDLRFRVAAEARQTPEFWWPIQAAAVFAAVESRHRVTPSCRGTGSPGSVFVVFRKGGGTGSDLDALARDTFPASETPAALTLDGPWQVEFPEGWGAPRTASFEKLQSWTESDHEGIRSFSGIATYRSRSSCPDRWLTRTVCSFNWVT